MNSDSKSNSSPSTDAERTARESMRMSFRMDLKSFSCCEYKINSALPDWLAELREMRARLLYDHGRRPHFQMADGKLDDPDPADLFAYHMIARSQGRPVWYARLLPPKHMSSGFILGSIGRRQWEAIVDELGTNAEGVCEGSWWAVVPESRGLLGRQIIAACCAVARWLSFRMVFVLACTSQKQDLALIRMGARPIYGLPLFTSSLSGDECRLLYFDVWHSSLSMARQIEESTELLKLGPLPHPADGQSPRSRTYDSSANDCTFGYPELAIICPHSW